MAVSETHSAQPAPDEHHRLGDASRRKQAAQAIG
jgi:hypothetical protein